MAKKELSVGDKAPHFSLKNQNGQTVQLKDFQGQWLVLYSYPKDMTPGCTREAIGFTELQGEFKKLGAQILGISPDSEESHCSFIEKEKLKINLLTDPDHKVLEDYAAWGVKKNYGKEYMGVIRSTFLIDPKGVLGAIWTNVKVDGHVDAVKEKLSELQSALAK